MATSDLDSFRWQYTENVTIIPSPPSSLTTNHSASDSATTTMTTTTRSRPRTTRADNDFLRDASATTALQSKESTERVRARGSRPPKASETWLSSGARAARWAKPMVEEVGPRIGAVLLSLPFLLEAAVVNVGLEGVQHGSHVSPHAVWN